MDFSKLSKGDQLVAGGALAFFIAMFLPWFSFGIAGISASANGWDYGFWGVLMFLLLLAAAALVLLPAAGKSINAPAITVFALAAVATVFVVLKFIIGEDSFNRGFGMILAVIGAGIATFGGFTKFKAAGGSIQDLKDPNKLKDQVQTGFQSLAKDIKDGIDDDKK
jgi:hypothetical protein